MAGVPPAALLLGAAALFLISKGKGGGGAKDKGDDGEPIPPSGEKEIPKYETPTPPKDKTQEELEEEFGPEAEVQADDTEAEVQADDTEAEVQADDTGEQIIAQAQWKKWPPGSELSQAVNDHGHNAIFASEDCEAALIGRDWSPVISLEDKLYDPAGFWREFGDGERPTKVLEGEGVSRARWFTQTLLLRNNAIIECEETDVPTKQDYPDPTDLSNAWTAYLNASRAFAYLFDEIYRNRVKEPMVAAWAEEDPDAHRAYMANEVAEWAVENFPNEDVTEQTDQAYLHAISGGDENAPKVLDPDNPEHEEYIDLWKELNEAIKAL